MRDVAIVAAVRTAIGKAGRGTLRDVRPDTLAAHVINAATFAKATCQASS